MLDWGEKLYLNNLIVIEEGHHVVVLVVELFRIRCNISKLYCFITKKLSGL